LKRDPAAPKRPLNSYLIFANEKRAEVKAANPAAKGTEVVSILAAKWRAMSAADKKPYDDKAALEKGRYLIEKKAYEESRPQPAVNKPDVTKILKA
jgi:hypothetical protein